MQQAKRWSIFQKVSKIGSVEPGPTISVHPRAIFQAGDQKREDKRTHRTNPEPAQNLRERHPSLVAHALGIYR